MPLREVRGAIIVYPFGAAEETRVLVEDGAIPDLRDAGAIVRSMVDLGEKAGTNAVEITTEMLRDLVLRPIERALLENSDTG